MAKKKTAQKKSGNTGRRGDSRSMASREQPKAPQQPRDPGCDHEIPRPHVTITHIDTLVAMNQQMVRRQEEMTGLIITIDAKLEGVAEMRERLRLLEVALHRPAENQAADVPASVLILRRQFAGACKSLRIVEPTPAILGRLMHDCRIFDPNSNRAPRNLFESIYAKPKRPNHLSNRIRELLEQYGNQPSSPEDETDCSDEGATTEQEPTTSRIKKLPDPSKQIGPEFDKRFELIENCGYGKREPVKHGGKTSYRRYLTPSGRVLFNGWPEWTDATGGVGLVDEEITPIPPSTPSGSSPANPTSVGGTDTTAAPT
jgi:hypothetical protein